MRNAKKFIYLETLMVTFLLKHPQKNLKRVQKK